jgi:apolipoprotein D and lipocalin family protein
MRLAVPTTAAVIAALYASGCQHPAPIATVSQVDLQRFMGDWYVIAAIPTFIEKDAYNAVESYRLDSDGTIDTTFTFNKGALDGKQKRYHPRGFVRDTQSNAAWGMRFVWPFKADYRIVHVSADYGLTVIGRPQRDYAWIMARSPTIADQDYNAMVELLKQQQYDTSQLRKVPHNQSGNDHESTR